MITRQRGFTLIELLVAVAIFAIVSVVAYTGLQAVMASRARVTTEASRLAKLQTAFSVMGRDFRQASTRGYRDRLGDPQPPMRLSADRLTFVRGGRRNPLDLPRSGFQRIAYGLNDDQQLVRYAWPAVDSAFEPEVGKTALLDDIDTLSFRFLTDGWAKQWPPAQAGLGSPGIPRAVEVRLTHPDYGKLRRVFLLP